MREGLIEELYKEIHGPRNGPEETLQYKDNPVKEYITGVIIPRNCKSSRRDPESETGVLLGGASTTDNTSDELQALAAPDLDPLSRPRSFGISFFLENRTPQLRICVTWGRYKKTSQNGESVWQRTPFRSIHTVPVDEDLSEPIRIKTKVDPNVELYIRRIPREDQKYSYLVSLINGTPIHSETCYDSALAKASIFQPSIRILAADGEKNADINFQVRPAQDALEYLYKTKSTRARGHMCSAMWAEIDYSDFVDESVWWPDGNVDDCYDFKRPDFRTEFVPLFHTAAPDFDWQSVEYEQEPELSAERLSELWTAESIDKALTPLIAGYDAWIQKNDVQVAGLADEDKRIAENIIRSQKEVLDRLRLGIELLKNDMEARIAFCFANRVIDLQDQWKTRAKTKPFTWRPFQLGFLLLCIEPLCNKSSSYRKVVDLLWIQTGGGKTEAYLAIMAFIIAFRKRTSKRSKNPLSGAGVAVLTRYTLRLLTIQQFRRTLSMITAAEYLRVFKCGKKVGWRPKECSIDDDWFYGTQRFSVGLWVGQGVTPNHLRGAENNALDALSKPGKGSEPAQITNCPVCQEWLSVPEFGLPAGHNKLHLIVKTQEDVAKSYQINSIDITASNPVVEGLTTDSRNLPQGYTTVTLFLNSPVELSERKVDDIVQSLSSCLSFEAASFRASRPGYFPSGNEPGRITKRQCHRRI